MSLFKYFHIAIPLSRYPEHDLIKSTQPTSNAPITSAYQTTMIYSEQVQMLKHDFIEWTIISIDYYLYELRLYAYKEEYKRFMWKEVTLGHKWLLGWFPAVYLSACLRLGLRCACFVWPFCVDFLIFDLPTKINNWWTKNVPKM